MKFSAIWRRGTIVLGTILSLSALSTAGEAHSMRAAARTDSSQTISIRTGQGSEQIVVAAGKSQLVHFDHHFRQIVVGNKDVAEVVPLTGNSIYILGKKRGTTNLTITDGGNSVVAAVDVVVTYDIVGLKRQLGTLVPGADIDIQPAGDALVLSGHVSSTDDLRTILAVADRFAPGAVTNLLKVGGSQQVMLEVKFSEVQRNAMQNLGLTIANAGVTNAGGVAATAAVAAGAFGTVGGLLTDNRTFFVRGQIDALEQKGFVHTLAEPNLVALSGDTASFLAGGEFPIPVVQSSTGTIPTTTIEYKDFGVGLAFTPTVVSNDLVNLAIKSEVSALDPTASVTTTGITVPGLKVRRAATTVELHDGQTFAIAGLIQDDFHDSLNALPGLGNIPVLGALFRSVNFQHQQSELVVFITVHLVQPLGKRGVVLPTDRVKTPSLTDMDLMGDMDGHPVAHAAPPPPPPPPTAEDPTPAPPPAPVEHSELSPPQPSPAPADNPTPPPSPTEHSELTPPPPARQQAATDPIAAQGYVLP